MRAFFFLLASGEIWPPVARAACVWVPCPFASARFWLDDLPCAAPILFSELLGVVADAEQPAASALSRETAANRRPNERLESNSCSSLVKGPLGDFVIGELSKPLLRLFSSALFCRHNDNSATRADAGTTCQSFASLNFELDLFQRAGRRHDVMVEP